MYLFFQDPSIVLSSQYKSFCDSDLDVSERALANYFKFQQLKYTHSKWAIPLAGSGSAQAQLRLRPGLEEGV